MLRWIYGCYARDRRTQSVRAPVAVGGTMPRRPRIVARAASRHAAMAGSGDGKTIPAAFLGPALERSRTPQSQEPEARGREDTAQERLHTIAQQSRTNSASHFLCRLYAVLHFPFFIWVASSPKRGIGSWHKRYDERRADPTVNVTRLILDCQSNYWF